MAVPYPIYCSYMRTSDLFHNIQAILMSTAMTKWDQNITNASELASGYVGFSPRVLHRWSFSYFTSLFEMFSITPENITDEQIEELSTDRGHSTPCPSSLIFDEDFMLQARTFV